MLIITAFQLYIHTLEVAMELVVPNGMRFVTGRKGFPVSTLYIITVHNILLYVHSNI